jgi:hypothetical protein
MSLHTFESASMGDEFTNDCPHLKYSRQNLNVLFLEYVKYKELEKCSDTVQY